MRFSIPLTTFRSAQGLADADDETTDDPDAEEEDFDESSPLFSPASSSGGAIAAQTAFEMALGPDYYKHRQGVIELKGYDRYLQEWVPFSTIHSHFPFHLAILTFINLPKIPHLYHPPKQSSPSSPSLNPKP